MKNLIKQYVILAMAGTFLLASCHSKLDEPALDEAFTSDVDYTISENMILPLLGAYEGLYTRGWEEGLLLGVRGDDVNAGGLGDQQPYSDTDMFNYDQTYWMYNSVWQLHYNDIFRTITAIQEISKYNAIAKDDDKANQYIAECRTIRAFLYLNLAKTFGNILIVTDLGSISVAPISSKEDVMEYIIDEIDDSEQYLPSVNPNKRTDIKGGITRYTALAIKAMAYQELGDYQGVADATSQIIDSGEYDLIADYYDVFKKPGKLSDENLLEFQFSDFGQSTGDTYYHLFAPYGPQDWTPAVTGASSGWGFYEPSEKFIKFMLDRGETVRLETSVIFTPDGMTQIESDASYNPLPGWVSNTTRDGDTYNNASRANFHSGKHYLPTNQYTPGRNNFAAGKNYTVIRYSEILLMHAEALTRGASSSSISADQAVKLVRDRAGMSVLSGVTTQQVLDEKYAELAMEWGIRYHDMVRTENTSALSYDGRTFSTDQTYLPVPQAQVDALPQF